MLMKALDDDALLDTSILTGLGTITLEMWRVQAEVEESFENQTVPEEQKIHERSKKAAFHRVK